MQHKYCGCVQCGQAKELESELTEHIKDHQFAIYGYGKYSGTTVTIVLARIIGSVLCDVSLRERADLEKKIAAICFISSGGETLQ